MLDLKKTLGTIEKFTDWERFRPVRYYKKWLRKLWQETRDPKYKTAVNSVTKSIRYMTTPPPPPKKKGI
jgi:hypothetical protein